ncbi:MAG: hypothetical protein J3R72DRAFT_431105 [Linnemannia gamsii]|nr:MAG: hypothetical protein J3R72DRAFT_431105 [Linnemannia gamsii]
MGVKGLTSLLQRLAPDAVRMQRISHYKGKSVAIDVSCFLNRFIYGLDPHPARVQRGLYRLCLYLHLNNIRPIFVFDGPTRIIEKESEGARREVIKEKVKKSFQLEKNRRTRLKGLKGSARILKDFSPEQVVSIMEDIRIRETGDGVGDGVGGRIPAVAVASELSDADDGENAAGRKDTDHAAASFDPETTTTTPRRPKKRKSAKRSSVTKSANDNKGLSPRYDLHLATIYDLLEDDSVWVEDEHSWTVPTLPDDFYQRLEQEQAMLLAHGDTHNHTASLEDQRLADAFDDEDERDLQDIDTIEQDLDMLDRMELDVETIGGLDVIYDLSDQPTTTKTDDDEDLRHTLPLVLRTGTSIHNLLPLSDNGPYSFVTPEPEDEAASLRKRVHAALGEYVRLIDKSAEDAEEDELTTNSTRKQRALNELELKLVQGIKEYTGLNVLENQADPDSEVEQIDQARSEAPLRTEGISSALPEPPTANETASQEEIITAATTTKGDSTPKMTTIEDLALKSITVEDTEPIWSVDSDPMDTLTMREDDPTLTEDLPEPDYDQDVEPTTPPPEEEADQDLKSMIHSVLSAHQSILMTLERRSMRVTWPLIVSCQRLLVAMGEPVVEAKDAEAEAVCAQLTTLGIADATMSEDTDTAVFGNGLLLRQVGATQGRGIIEINPVLAKEGLGLNHDAFRDLCILCGTDFSGTIEGIGPNRAVKLIQYFGSIESIMANTDYKPRPDFVYDRARRVFDRTPAVPLDPTAYQPKPEIQPLLLELLLKYDINPEEIKQELLSDIKAEEMSHETGFDRAVKAAAMAAEAAETVTFNSSSSMGIDPFKATAIKLPSLWPNSSH